MEQISLTTSTIRMTTITPYQAFHQPPLASLASSLHVLKQAPIRFVTGAESVHQTVSQNRFIEQKEDSKLVSLFKDFENPINEMTMATR